MMLENEEEYIERIIKEFLDYINIFRKNKSFENDDMIRLLEDTKRKLEGGK